MAEETTKTATATDPAATAGGGAGDTKPPAPEPVVEAGKSTLTTEKVVEAGKEGATIAGGEKKTEPAAAVKPAEFKADALTLPEGSLMDAKATETLASFSKEHGLSEKQAQASLERESAALSAYVENATKSMEAESVKWVEDIKKDTEFGGDKFNQTAESAKRFVTRFGDPEFQKALTDTGFGNHPGLVKMLARAARAMGDDKLVMPGAQPSTTPKSAEDIMYGGDKKE